MITEVDHLLVNVNDDVQATSTQVGVAPLLGALGN